MPTAADTAELLKLQARIQAMTLADRLRLCAELLDQGKNDLAETITGQVSDELWAARVHGVRSTRI